MYILKDMTCSKCDGEICVVPCEDEYGQKVVSHGICVDCSKIQILPVEPFNIFVRKYCERTNEENAYGS